MAPIAALMAISAGGGIFIHDLYRDVPGLVAQAKGQDLISLFFVLPILVISAILARRGSILAHLIWIGGLVYLVYTYVSFAFAIRYNPLFLAYITLLGCSLYALIYSFVSLDMAEVKMRFTEKAPVKPICIYIAAIVLLFYFFWLSDLIPALIAGKVPQSIVDDQTPTNAIHVLDMAWILPAFAITAISLWRKNSLGYTLAGVMLTFFVMLVTATLSMGILGALAGDPAAVPMIVMFGGLLASAIGMLVWYTRSLRNQSGMQKKEPAK
jgi:hypothetical protein